jgi:hypothetical protein
MPRISAVPRLHIHVGCEALSRRALPPKGPNVQQGLNFVRNGPPTIASLLLGGRTLDRQGDLYCQCGRTIPYIMERQPEGYIGRPNPNSYKVDGRELIWSSKSSCPSCQASYEIETLKPGLRTNPFDRGVHRLALARTIAWCTEKATRRGELEAELLTEIDQANPTGEWVPLTAFVDHACSSILAAIVANLRGHAGPPDAKIDLGSVMVEQGHYHNIHRPTLIPLLDQHARDPGGVYGKLPEAISEQAGFCSDLASRPEVNLMSINGRDGPVRSRFPTNPINDLYTTIDICTFLEGGSAVQTFVILNVHAYAHASVIVNSGQHSRG